MATHVLVSSGRTPIYTHGPVPLFFIDQAGRLAAGDKGVWEEFRALALAHDRHFLAGCTESIAACALSALAKCPEECKTFVCDVVGAVECAGGWATLCAAALARLDGDLAQAEPYVQLVRAVCEHEPAKAQCRRLGAIRTLVHVLERGLPSVPSDESVEDACTARPYLYDVGDVLSNIMCDADADTYAQYVECGGLQLHLSLAYQPFVKNLVRYVQSAVSDGTNLRLELQDVRHKLNEARAVDLGALSKARVREAAAVRRAALFSAACDILRLNDCPTSLNQFVCIVAGAMLRTANEQEEQEEAECGAQDDGLQVFAQVVKDYLDRAVNRESVFAAVRCSALDHVAVALRACIGDAGVHQNKSSCGGSSAHCAAAPSDVPPSSDLCAGKRAALVLTILADMCVYPDVPRFMSLTQWQAMSALVTRTMLQASTLAKDSHWDVVPLALHVLAAFLRAGEARNATNMYCSLVQDVVRILGTVAARTSINVSQRLATFAAASRVLNWRPRESAGQPCKKAWTHFAQSALVRSFAELLCASTEERDKGAADEWQLHICEAATDVAHNDMHAFAEAGGVAAALRIARTQKLAREAARQLADTCYGALSADENYADLQQDTVRSCAGNFASTSAAVHSAVTSI